MDPSPPAGGTLAQLYHHERPGEVAVGANAADGATLAAIPRLQALAAGAMASRGSVPTPPCPPSSAIGTAASTAGSWIGCKSLEPHDATASTESLPNRMPPRTTLGHAAP